MTAYYNDNESYVCRWLENLIREGLIPGGDVDDRPIQEVQPEDLRGYTQVHLFAGIGGWAHALQIAGWPADRPVWTGSCPCQPFSSAGQRRGTADDRHLWPCFRDLIAQCSPPVVFGEQVASSDGLQWLSAVRSDLEALGFCVGAADLCAASVGAPHIRQRLWWVAHTDGRHSSTEGLQRSGKHRQQPQNSSSNGLADTGCPSHERRMRPSETHGAAGKAQGKAQQQQRSRPDVGRCGSIGGLGHASDAGLQRNQQKILSGPRRGQKGRAITQSSAPSGYWNANDLIRCTDGKTRLVEPGSFPLADGIPARMGKLRAYGNSIVPQVAAEFIAAYLETE